MQQCVAIDCVGGDAALSSIGDVHGLSNWLHGLYTGRLDGGHADEPTALLLICNRNRHHKSQLDTRSGSDTPPRARVCTVATLLLLGGSY